MVIGPVKKYILSEGGSRKYMCVCEGADEIQFQIGKPKNSSLGRLHCGQKSIEMVNDRENFDVLQWTSIEKWLLNK